ncbi:MAG: S-methyl-5-thioribose-1-phosphate isomerase, partial [Gammaproteobacteria bacterium]
MNEHQQLSVQALQWTGKSLKVLDQRLLPESIVYDEYHDAAGVAEAIKTMRVRGAPAIGIAAAYGVVLSVQLNSVKEPEQWRQRVADDIEILAHSRPTAVNLFWALEQMKNLLQATSDQPVPKFLALAQKIHA